MSRSILGAPTLIAWLLGAGCGTAPPAPASTDPVATASAAHPPAASPAANPPTAALPAATTPGSPPPAPPAAAAPPSTPESAPEPATPNDYSQLDNWLCIPGHNTACEVNLDTTVIAANGKMTVEKLAPAKDPPIDCFYVYPTVSRDPGMVATMKAEPEELGVVAATFPAIS